MTPCVLNKMSPFVSYRQLRACTCIHLPTHTCIRLLPWALRIRRRFGRRVAHGVPFDGPGSASMALEAPFRAPSCFWAEQWVSFVQFELKKTRPHTWPEPFLPALIPSIPLGLAGRRGGRPQARNGAIFASCGSVLVF